MVDLAVKNHFESPDGIINGNCDSFYSRKLFGYSKRLGEKTLYSACAVYGYPVLLGELFHSKNRDNILEFLVALQYLLYPLRRIVMLMPHDIGIENARSRIKRVNCRIYSKFGNLAAENSRSIKLQMPGLRRSYPAA